MADSIVNGRLVKEIVNTLLISFEIKEIESAIIELYLETRNIKIIKNDFLKKQLQYSSRTETIKSQLLKHILFVDLKTVEKVFEILIPTSDRRINGAFYTPFFIVDYIVKKTVTQVGTVFDPSCGSGAFLVEATKRLKELSKKSIIEIIEEFIYGCDILDYAVRRTKIILSLLAIENNEDKKNIDFNIVCEDSLLVNWEEIFPKQIRNQGIEQHLCNNEDEKKDKGFYFIVGNPPYIRIQDLSDEIKDKLRKRWRTVDSGNFNIYFAFFELAYNLVNKNGQIGFIVPKNFFTSLAAIKLRKWMHLHRSIKEIVDFNHLQIFEDVTTYTCIIIISKNRRDIFNYCLVEAKENLDGIHHLQFSQIHFKDLNSKKWRLLNEIDFMNVKKIEGIGTPLGKLCTIKSSIATLKDRIYFVDSSNENGEYYIKKYNDRYYSIEKNITRDVVKISSVKSEADIKNNTLKLIFPYEKKMDSSISILSETKLKKRYPMCYEYFCAAKEELSSRDKGKREYIEWYAYGRGQGLGMKGIRILTPTFSKKPRFLIDWNKDALYTNGYGIFLDSSREDVIVLRKILNSIIMDYYIQKTSVHLEGGFPCFQKNFIELFSIPHLKETEKKFILEETNPEKLDKFLKKKYDICF